MEAEKSRGFEPFDRECEKLGYDIESRMPDGQLRLIKVRGRVSGMPTITVARSEILCPLNKSDAYILSIIEFFENGDHEVHYVRRPYRKDLDFEASSVSYSTLMLLARAQPPS